MFFIDESGSMPKYLDTRYKYRYFIIGFVHTSDPRHLKQTYKRAIRNLRRKYPDFYSGLKNPNECKASEMLPFMKEYILNKLVNTTDIKIAFMTVNNMEIDQRFRENPGRSFNYLIKIILENFPLTPGDIDNLQLNIDNRNTALDGLSELEGYLYNVLVLEKDIVRDVNVNYLESCDNYNIQVADLIANVIYQRFRYKTLPFPAYSEITEGFDRLHPYTFEYLYNIIKPKCTIPFVYPVKDDLIREASLTIEL